MREMSDNVKQRPNNSTYGMLQDGTLICRQKQKSFNKPKDDTLSYIFKL